MNSRRIALDILKKIEKGSYSNILLNNHLKEIHDKRDRALITELVYGVLRQKKRLDYIIAFLANRSINKLDKEVLIALRLGIYQLEFLDKIPARAAVNETVNCLKGLVNKGAIGFTNALLRSYIRRKKNINYPDSKKEPVSYLSTYYSYPEWLIDIWINQYGFNDTRRLCEINNNPPKLIIRRNSLKYGEKEFIKIFKEKGIKIEPLAVNEAYFISGFDNIKSLPLYSEGGFIVQGPAAILASHILNPEPESRVLDMAAGPGGKTTHLGQIMKNKGKIIAIDIYDHKLELVKENCKRLGINIVDYIHVDGRTFNDENGFDFILLDAPCSGLGLISSKPEIKWNKSPEDIEQLRVIQMSMLEKAVKLLKRGGYLLYSTCTLNYEENQGVIQEFINRHGMEIELCNIDNDLERLGLKGIYSASREGWLELFPPDSGTEGFFMAKLKKVGGNN